MSTYNVLLSCLVYTTVHTLIVYIYIAVHNVNVRQLSRKLG